MTDETNLYIILWVLWFEKEQDLFEKDYLVFFKSNGSMNRRRWLVIRDYCIGWTIAFIVLSIVRGAGTVESGDLKFDFLSSFMIVLTMGPILGIISGYAQIWTEERIYKRISIQRLLLVRLLYAILFVILLTLLAYGVYRMYFGLEVSLITFAFERGSLAVIFYVLLVDFIFGVFRQVNLMLGGRQLREIASWRILYSPRRIEDFHVSRPSGIHSIGRKIGPYSIQQVDSRLLQ